ncbi:hypothetical protein OPQ81_002211 [Rhizoctonia solani]|nr:hypothetical protein OPQ81_002211 [Rhizoctonia solani]
MQRASSTNIARIELWKSTKRPSFHEYLLVLLEEGGVLRLERMGGGSIFAALRGRTVPAYDMIQYFHPQEYRTMSHLQQPTELVARLATVQEEQDTPENYFALRLRGLLEPTDQQHKSRILGCLQAELGRLTLKFPGVLWHWDGPRVSRDLKSNLSEPMDRVVSHMLESEGSLARAMGGASDDNRDSSQELSTTKLRRKILLQSINDVLKFLSQVLLVANSKYDKIAREDPGAHFDIRVVVSLSGPSLACTFMKQKNAHFWKRIAGPCRNSIIKLLEIQTVTTTGATIQVRDLKIYRGQAGSSTLLRCSEADDFRRPLIHTAYALIQSREFDAREKLHAICNEILRKEDWSYCLRMCVHDALIGGVRGLFGSTKIELGRSVPGGDVEVLEMSVSDFQDYIRDRINNATTPYAAILLNTEHPSVSRADVIESMSEVWEGIPTDSSKGTVVTDDGIRLDEL